MGKEFNFWDCRGLEPNQTADDYLNELKEFAQNIIDKILEREHKQPIGTVTRIYRYCKHQLKEIEKNDK